MLRDFVQVSKTKHCFRRKSASPSWHFHARSQSLRISIAMWLPVPSYPLLHSIGQVTEDFCYCALSLFSEMPCIDVSSFIPLTQMPQASFGSGISMTQSSVITLFGRLRLNPAFLLNMIGRPDYWAPQARWEFGEAGSLVACGTFYKWLLFSRILILRYHEWCQISFASIHGGISQSKGRLSRSTCAMTLFTISRPISSRTSRMTRVLKRCGVSWI